MHVEDLQHQPEWLEDDRRCQPNRSRLLIDPRDQARLGIAESQWICRHCGAFLEDEWDVCACRS